MGSQGRPFEEWWESILKKHNYMSFEKANFAHEIANEAWAACLEQLSGELAISDAAREFCRQHGTWLSGEWRDNSKMMEKVHHSLESMKTLCRKHETP